jgi:ABC-type multidrug transport system permease subunit
MYTNVDSLLAYFGIHVADRWWQWGVTVVYNVINIGIAILLYWAVKVPKDKKKK